jgi:large subunit ribosomal protein L16
MLQPARRNTEGQKAVPEFRHVATSVAGDFGLKCTDRGRLTARQIEAARRAISVTSNGGRIPDP